MFNRHFFNEIPLPVTEFHMFECKPKHMIAQYYVKHTCRQNNYSNKLIILYLDRKFLE